MTRLYCNTPLSLNRRIELPTSAAHHTIVLRLKSGDKITLFDGNGGEYTAKIVDISRFGTTVDILSYQQIEKELSYRITLVQSLPEASKMDWIIEKSIELGVAQICPVESQRSVIRLTKEKAEKRISRWKNIIIAASEQCGRNSLAELANIETFKDWLKQNKTGSVLIFTPRANHSLSDWAFQNPRQDVTFLIGPEGGFSQEEENLAMEHGALALSLGDRILRTETAGIVAVAALTAIWNKEKN